MTFSETDRVNPQGFTGREGFDPSQHPRATDGTVTEKVGADAEVKLSVTDLDRELFDDVQRQAEDAYVTYTRAVVTERIQRDYPTAVRATLEVEDDEQGIVKVTSVEDADGAVIWSKTKETETDGIAYSAASVLAGTVKTGDTLDLGGYPDASEAFKHYVLVESEMTGVAAQALANRIRLRFPTAVAVELDPDDDYISEPDIERRPVAVLNAAGERLWTSGSGDDSIFAEDSDDREYLGMTRVDFDAETESSRVLLPVNLFDESTWPESPF